MPDTPLPPPSESASCRRAGWVLTFLTAVAVALVLPFDGPLSQWARQIPTPGDVGRTLETLQQWGDFASLVLTSLFIFLLDPAQRRRLADLWLSLGLTMLACVGFVLLLGRPRPHSADAPWAFTWPWQSFTFADGRTLHGWELFASGHSQLWSMPSRHTLAAAVLSVFLTQLYPRLRPLAVTMVIIVAVIRVILGAHWPTDVIVGAWLGYVIAQTVVRRRLGSRLLEPHGNRLLG